MIKVTYGIDYLDPKPEVRLFDELWEAQDWAAEEVKRRVGFIVEHSQYLVSEQDLLSIEKSERCLVRIEIVPE